MSEEKKSSLLTTIGCGCGTLLVLAIIIPFITKSMGCDNGDGINTDGRETTTRETPEGYTYRPSHGHIADPACEVGGSFGYSEREFVKKYNAKLKELEIKNMNLIGRTEFESHINHPETTRGFYYNAKDGSKYYEFIGHPKLNQINMEYSTAKDIKRPTAWFAWSFEVLGKIIYGDNDDADKVHEMWVDSTIGFEQEVVDFRGYRWTWTPMVERIDGITSKDLERTVVNIQPIICE